MNAVWYNSTSIWLHVLSWALNVSIPASVYDFLFESFRCRVSQAECRPRNLDHDTLVRSLLLGVYSSTGSIPDQSSTYHYETSDRASDLSESWHNNAACSDKPGTNVNQPSRSASNMLCVYVQTLYHIMLYDPALTTVMVTLASQHSQHTCLEDLSIKTCSYSNTED